LAHFEASSGLRVPIPVDSLQVNFCKNMSCRHFGNPASPDKQPRGPGASDRPNDGYTISSNHPFLKRLVCRSCKQYSIIKSNLATIEELERISAYLQPKKINLSCPNKDCENHRIEVCDFPDSYYTHGATNAGTKRYQCKKCKRTFSNSGKTTRRQRIAYKNKQIFKQIVNRVPIKRISEISDVSPETVYRKIEYFHSQCLEFAASRERNLYEQLDIDRLYVASDRQEFAVNWTNTRDKRNVILKAIASADIDTGYVFGMHLNFDPNLNSDLVEKDALDIGDNDLAMPFRKYARVWLQSDHKRMVRARGKANEAVPEGGLMSSVARYKNTLSREEIEASDEPTPQQMLPHIGMQVHEEYTLYAHFLFLKRLFGNVEKVRFYLDQDSGIRAACLSAFKDEVMAGTCDAFYVRINKDLTIHQKQRIVAASERDFRDLRSEYPYLSDKSLRLLRITADMKRLEKIGKWEDRWLEYPFADMSEPEKAVCYLTDRNDYGETHLAHLYHKASLHSIDSYFNQVRTRVSALDRGKGSQSNLGRKWYGYQPYSPAMVQKFLDILRVYHNYCLKSKKSKDTPAMRIGLARAPLDPEVIINFKPNGE